MGRMCFLLPRGSSGAQEAPEWQVRGSSKPGGYSQPLLRFRVAPDLPLTSVQLLLRWDDKDRRLGHGRQEGTGHAAGHAVSSSMFAAGIVALGDAGAEASP